ncbi:MAG: RecQ family ATP-dependent DNA helicase [Planctomycetes bacterium]|nr:RecQ family ATP-dependent DNA helicase [Planctomycetota bacterium]
MCPVSESSPLNSQLKQYFGFDNFRPGQAEVVESMLEGHSCLAVFPTGSGKSLCFQLSALLMEGTALVVSPLMALMKDQVDFLNSKGIAAGRLDSSLSLDEYRELQSALHGGKLKLLYVSPERFSNERFVQSLASVNISFMVIDEVHCISEWGHNFRPDYLKLSKFMSGLGIKQMLGLTATATPDVVEDICKTFSIAEDHYVYTGFYRPNLTLRSEAENIEYRKDQIVAFLKEKTRGATVIYVTLQATSEEVAAHLTANGLVARAYHAGMNDEDRKNVQEWFMEDPNAIVAATIAFGMGIDKSDIRYVLHYNLPKSLENYSQEIGRAGRDGEPSTCVMVGNDEDLTVLENFVYGDTPHSLDLIKAIASLVESENEEFGVSTYKLSQQFDIRPLVLNTLLTYLELEGIIEATGAYYNMYRYQPLKSSAQILSYYKGEPVAFLRNLFKVSTPGRTWFTLDVNKAIKILRTDRVRIVKAFNHLEENGYAKVQPRELMQGFRLKKKLNEEELNQLNELMISRFAHREQSDIKRLQLVKEMLIHKDCRVNYLLNYFGEVRSDPCGHCDNCLGDVEEEYELNERISEISAEDNLVIRGVASSSIYEKLESSRSITRFLCGITSPVITRAKFSRHDKFGALKHLPFELVLKGIDASGLR